MPDLRARLQGLVAQWREHAADCERAKHHTGDYESRYSGTFLKCADDLNAILATVSPLPATGGAQVKQPSLVDRVVKVRAYLTDEAFGYEHWRAAQFSAPKHDRHGVLLLFDTEAERDAAFVGALALPPQEEP